jgi:hypothetical protein
VKVYGPRGIPLLCPFDVPSYDRPFKLPLAVLEVRTEDKQSRIREIRVFRKKYLHSSSCISVLVPSYWHCGLMCFAHVVIGLGISEVLNAILQREFMALGLSQPKQPA